MTKVEEIKRRWNCLDHIFRKANLLMAIELQNTFNRKRQKRRLKINIATLSNKALKQKGLASFKNLRTLWKKLNCLLPRQKRHHKN